VVLWYFVVRVVLPLLSPLLWCCGAVVLWCCELLWCAMELPCCVLWYCLVLWCGGAVVLWCCLVLWCM
jgi:hypothetical protein